MDDETAGMTPEDRRHWDAIQQWKAKRLREPARELPPGPESGSGPEKVSWRDRVSHAAGAARERVGGIADRIPLASETVELAGRALRGLADAGARAGAASVRPDAVAEAYRKRGYDISTLADVQKLELADILRVKGRLNLSYIAASAAQGAGTGFLASGGTMIAVGGTVGTGGVAAAPSAGVVVGAVAADAISGVLAANRAVAHIAAYFGHDVNEPAERVIALGVLSMGLAGDAGKLVAYREFNGVVQALARRQAWSQLGQNQVTQIVSAVYRSLGMTLTKKKLAAAVPVVGVAIGAGLNARSLARVVDDAEHLYMERHLREKYGLALDSVAENVESGGVIDVIDAEIESMDDDPGATGTA